MTVRRTWIGSAALASLCACATSSETKPALDPTNAQADWAAVTTPDHAALDWKSHGSTPYFVLEPGYTLVLENQSGKTHLTITVLDETKLVDGVETRVVEEREMNGGELAEVSRNYFAIAKSDNGVYYFGEDVDIYKHGKVVASAGSWQSGESGAHYGLMMPGAPVLGARYYQERAPEVAMDRAEIVSLDETVQTPAGTFEKCVKTEETTPIEKGKEYKLYAPGIGVAVDDDLRLIRYGQTASASAR